ncbi:MAG: arginine--tRNA ligase, partial [Planctomycetota bacterium]
IAGPGFINLRLRDDWLTAALAAARADVDRLAVEPVNKPRTVVIDYSSPNVAKPMHVGHIRSTVIGDALASVLRMLGHRVITDNHIGDWGTQFGMIIYGWKSFADEAAFADATADVLVPELTRLYRLVNQIADYQATKTDKLPALTEKLGAAREKAHELGMVTFSGDPKLDKKTLKNQKRAEAAVAELEKEQQALEAAVADFEADSEMRGLATAHTGIAARALAETAKLHEGDAENRALWDRFLPACMEEIDKTYTRLGVGFDHTLGESFYQPMLAGVVGDLRTKGIATESDGAVIVPAESLDLAGNEAPFLVRKKDGAFLYATTDLATIKWRRENWNPDAILYVVDHRQSLHFDQLFATAALWGFGSLELTHVAFGTVLGEDGRPFKTRSGSSVGLMGLLDEAVTRAKAIADKSDVLESDEERATVAERIGIGAIKYADLAHNRESDYTFSYDKMLAMQGNTAAYMQYSCARVRGIFTKGGVDAEALRSSGATIELGEPAERALGLALVQFAEALDRVAADYKPNHLTAYLFDLAGRYFDFYEKCPVLKAESDTVKQSRLLLCDLTARTLEKGLGLLGIEVVERM